MTTESTEELGGFDDAVAAAVAELEAEAGESETPTDLPSDGPEAADTDDQAEDESDEQAEEPTESATQPEEAEEEIEEIFADIEVSEDPEAEQASPDLESMTFELPGVEEPVSLQELKDGYLRQDDYTRKTQETARTREEYDQAIRLYEALTGENAMSAVRRLAVDAGLIQEGQEPIAEAELSPLRTAEQVEAEIQRRVEQAVSQDPRVLKAQEVEVRQWMEDSFSALEEKYEVTLGPKSRRAILQRAQKAGTNDLDLVFNSLMAQKQKRAAAADELKAAAPSRSTGRSTKQAPDEPASIEEAWAIAEVSHGARG